MAESPTSRYARTIDKSTLVPIGAVVSVCLTFFGGWQYLDSRFDGLEEHLKDQGREVQSLRTEVSRDRWTRTEHRLWVAELRRQNPELPIPPIPALETPR